MKHGLLNLYSVVKVLFNLIKSREYQLIIGLDLYLDGSGSFNNMKSQQ